MARTVRREPIYVPIPKVNDGFFVHNEFKGICDTKNDVNVDQRTFSDAKNVYIDERGLLTSRLPLRISDHTEQWIVDEWMFGNIGFRLYRIIEDDYFNFCLSCYTHPTKEAKGVGQLDSIIWKCKVDDLGYDFLPKVALIEAEDKIFVWFGGISFYCFNTTDFYFEDAKKYIYIPIHKLVTNGLEGEAESKNFLTNTYIKRYEYSVLSSVSFNDLIGKELTVILESDNKEKKLYTITVDENQAIALIYPYSYIGEDYYVDMVQTSRAMVIMRFHKTLKTIDVSFDGRMFKPLPLLKSIVGRPYLTRDGMGVFAFTIASLAKCKLVAQESDDFIEEGILTWEMEEYCKKSETTVNAIDDAFTSVGYFQSVTSFVYIIREKSNLKKYCYCEWHASEYFCTELNVINKAVYMSEEDWGKIGEIPDTIGDDDPLLSDYLTIEYPTPISYESQDVSYITDSSQLRMIVEGNLLKVAIVMEEENSKKIVLLVAEQTVGNSVEWGFNYVERHYGTPLYFESKLKDIALELQSINRFVIAAAVEGIYDTTKEVFCEGYLAISGGLIQRARVIGIGATRFKIFLADEMVATEKYVWTAGDIITFPSVEKKNILETKDLVTFNTEEEYFSVRTTNSTGINITDSVLKTGSIIVWPGTLDTGHSRLIDVAVIPILNYGPKKLFIDSREELLSRSVSRTDFGSRQLIDSMYHDGLWVFVGALGRIYYTDNLNSPLVQHPNSPFGDSDIYTITYGDGVWIAAGDDGKLATTTDPTGEWTLNTDFPGTKRITKILYSEEASYWICGCYGGEIYTAIFPTGDGWKLRQTPFNNQPDTNRNIFSIAYVQGNWLVGGDGLLAYITGGNFQPLAEGDDLSLLRWNIIFSNTAVWYRDIAFDDNVIVVATHNAINYKVGSLSTEGWLWHDNLPLEGNHLVAIATKNGLWVAGGAEGRIYTTDDPLGQWSLHPASTLKLADYIDTITFGQEEIATKSNRFVITKEDSSEGLFKYGDTILLTALVRDVLILPGDKYLEPWVYPSAPNSWELGDEWPIGFPPAPPGWTPGQSIPQGDPVVLRGIVDFTLQPIPFEGDPLYVNKTELWYSRRGTLWTSSLNLNARLYLDELVGDKSMTSVVPDQSVMFQSHMLSYDKTLQIASPARDDNYNFMWYLPKLNERKLNRRITALHPLSQEELGIFTEDGLWYQSTQIQFAPVKSKLPIICKDGNEVATALNGSLILFATPRGITALAPQVDVATTEQTLTYLSDTIQGIYEGFYNEPVPDINKLTHNTHMEYHRPMIRLATYKYWVLFYKFLSREILLFDTRNGSWWRWETQYPVKKIIAGETLSFLLQVDFDPLQVPGKEGTKLGIPFELKEFEEYSDEVIEDSINGDSEYIPNEGSRLFDKASSTIDWLISSQPLHFDKINNFKTIKALNLSVRGDYIQPMQLRLKAYREVYHPENTAIFDYKVVDNKTPESTTVFDYRVTELRTYVQRMNIMRACNFQYTLSLDPEAEVQTPIQLNSISVKYEVKEKVR